MKKSLIIFSVGILGIGIWIARTPSTNTNAAPLDTFAKCLTENGVTMYGAAWCPHCQNEKKAFGNSFQYIQYVECPKNPSLCLSQGINGYPTWIFSDGKRLEGEQGIQKLMQESGCILPDSL